MIQLNSITLVEVDGRELYTFEAYCELRLQMSTGDFHSHHHQIVTVDASLEYTDIDETGEFYLVNELERHTTRGELDECDHNECDHVCTIQTKRGAK